MLTVSDPDWPNWKVLYWEGLHAQSLMSLSCLTSFFSCLSPRSAPMRGPVHTSCEAAVHTSTCCCPSLLGPLITALSVSPCWQKPQHQKSSKLSSKKSQLGECILLLFFYLAEVCPISAQGCKQWQTEACRSNSILHGMGNFLGTQPHREQERKELKEDQWNLHKMLCLWWMISEPLLFYCSWGRFPYREYWNTVRDWNL